jgi:hypothetical protein
VYAGATFKERIAQIASLIRQRSTTRRGLLAHDPGKALFHVAARLVSLWEERVDRRTLMTKWRQLSALIATSVATCVFAAEVAAAQNWPTRPVPFAAGSASDTVGRILGARLSEVLGQQVIIENVSGAGGMTGVARVAKAPPDGYQFVLGGIDTFAQSQSLYKRPLSAGVGDAQGFGAAQSA